MMLSHPQLKARDAGLNFFSFSGRILSALLLVGGIVSGASGQDRPSTIPPKPLRVVTIQGLVSLPEGMSAERVIVTLISGAGVPRQAYTNEQGRFEFQGIEEGGYTLTAQSMRDPHLTSESILADTSHTATGNLNINLTLRRESEGGANSQPAEVVSAVEADQKVPKGARRAFKDGVKFRKDNKADKALESFTRAVELYPEYFQALAERGDMHVLQRQLKAAAADFESAIKINPRYGPALRGAGYCKLEGREFAEAISYLERSITAQPDNANAYLLVGIANLELDRREPARMALFKALSFNSRHELRAYIYLGNLYARERMYKEAADQLEKYLEANPTAPDAAEIKAREAQWRTRAATP